MNAFPGGSLASDFFGNDQNIIVVDVIKKHRNWEVHSYFIRTNLADVTLILKMGYIPHIHN